MPLTLADKHISPNNANPTTPLGSKLQCLHAALQATGSQDMATSKMVTKTGQRSSPAAQPSSPGHHAVPRFPGRPRSPPAGQPSSPVPRPLLPPAARGRCKFRHEQYILEWVVFYIHKVLFLWACPPGTQNPDKQTKTNRHWKWGVFPESSRC